MAPERPHDRAARFVDVQPDGSGGFRLTDSVAQAIASDGNSTHYPTDPMALLRDWGHGQGIRVLDALTHFIVFGGTGSGKSSAVAKHVAFGFLKADPKFGGLILTAKKDERRQWEQWARETGREDDLIIVSKDGPWVFDPLEWEASRPGEGGGLAMNIVALLMEIAGALGKGAGNADGSGGGDNRYWEDSLRHLLNSLTLLALLAGLKVSLRLMRQIVSSAARDAPEWDDPKWRDESMCWAVIQKADANTQSGDPEMRATFEEVKEYWRTCASLSERTRSITTQMFLMLAEPFLTYPLRRLFTGESTVTPEATFDGKLVVVDLPVQEFHQAGRLAQLAWKYCFQRAVLQRSVESASQRVAFLFADECQEFISKTDIPYLALARGSGGASVLLTQNRGMLLDALHSEAGVDALLGNCQTKVFCQNSDPVTNDYAAKLLGERWVSVQSVNVGGSTPSGDGGRTTSSGVTVSDQRRYLVEPSRFTTLKRGGPNNGNQVEAIVYQGGHQFPVMQNGEAHGSLPYILLTFDQTR